LRIALSTLGVELPGLRVAPDRTTRRDPIFFARGYEELHVAWDTDVKRAGLSRAPRAQRV
jgi:hypothetical protein